MHAPRVRFVAREVGPTTIGVLVVAQAVLWTLARPSGEPTGSYIGQLLGAESILLLSIGLVLISTPASLRGVVVAARDAPGVREARRIFGGYERWRALHRTTGLFVAAGFVHGVLDGTPFDDVPALRWSYVAVGAVGLGFYVYRELLARFFLSLHDYQVQSVREVDEGVVEIAMAPIGRHMDFVPGQFAMIYIEAKDGWHRHPFTITSAPHEDVVRVTVKALGDYTSRLQELIEPGMPAVIGGPHGRFSHWKGTERQVWIAGGVGVAPFLSWLRALDGHQLPHRVDFFYSADGEAPFADEIRAIADRHESLCVHLIDTGIDGRLTSERVLAVADADRAGLSVFMCGPRQMLSSFQNALRVARVPARRIHREYFDWR